MTLKMRKFVLFGSILTLGVAIQLSVMNYFKGIQVSAVPRLNPIVRLVKDGRTYCTGTVVSANLLITAAHCIMMETEFGSFPDDGPIDIRASDNKDINVTARMVFASPQMDQAMMTGDFRLFEPKKFISNPAALTAIKNKTIKANFTSCGYPLNGDLYCSETSFEKNDHFFWAVNGVLIPGMSGGPTMLPDGAVVAVNVAVSGELSIVSPIYNITKNLPRKK